jgi:hypothetical protein
MKSLVNDVLSILLAVCKDYEAAYPSDRWISRDKERLTRMVRSRGLGFLTMDLPNLDAILKNGLETGRLALVGPLSVKVSKRIQVPRLFRGLWLRIFRPDSCLRHDADITAIAFLTQLSTVAKKLEVGCSDDREKLTIKEYIDVEEELPYPSLAWMDDFLGPISSFDHNHLIDGLDPNYVSSHRGSLPLGERSLAQLLYRTQRFADEVATQLIPFHAQAVSDVLYEYGGKSGHRHGPGAVSDQKGYFNKYSFINWSKKLDRVFPYRIHGTLPCSPIQKVPQNDEHPSELLAVPKTAKSPRLIAAEPTEHQWCQQLVKVFVEFEISRVFEGQFVNFRSQKESQILALRSSLEGDTVTVDLSSASDRLSCWLVERLFRKAPELLFALHATRTRIIGINNPKYSSEPVYLGLKKYASQGTATTFPIQTFVFLILVLACSPGKDLAEKIRLNRGRVQVFGDDIIMPKSGYDDLKLLFPTLGLKINEEKSFSEGSYRESCGMDAFKGYDITPVKPRSLRSDGPKSRTSLVDTANNFFNKGYWHTSRAVESIGRSFIMKLPIVGRDSGVIGRTSFVGSDDSHLVSRWNHRLQRREVKTWSFRARSIRKPTNDYPGLLQYFTEAPSPLTKWEHGIPGKSKTSDGLRWEASVCPELYSG